MRSKNRGCKLTIMKLIHTSLLNFAVSFKVISFKSWSQIHAVWKWFCRITFIAAVVLNWIEPLSAFLSYLGKGEVGGGCPIQQFFHLKKKSLADSTVWTGILLWCWIHKLLVISLDFSQFFQWTFSDINLCSVENNLFLFNGATTDTLQWVHR